MKSRTTSCLLTTLAASAWLFSGCANSQRTITQDELVRRTQEIMDATTAGNPDPWKRHFAEDAVYFDEKGRFMDKPALIKDVAPLPNGYSGSIKVIHPVSRILSDTAILTYDLDETEVIFGQELHARYHGTDTWVFRNGQWQILGGQMLRYYEDPAIEALDPASYKKYLGTYQLASGITREVATSASTDGQLLSMQRTGRAPETLLPEAPDIFFRKGVEGRILFRRDGAGNVNALVDRRNNEDVVWQRIR